MQANSFWVEFLRTIFKFWWGRKFSRRLLTSSIKREIRHFPVVVVQWQQRNVQKSVLHVQSCCFAYSTHWFFDVLVVVAVVVSKIINGLGELLAYICTGAVARTCAFLPLCLCQWKLDSGPGGGKGNSHIKVTKMPVVSLRGVNCKFWSNLGCLGRKDTIFAHSGGYRLGLCINRSCLA